MEAVENIAKYQNQTRNWRDNKVIKKIIQDGDLVLRRRPNAKNVGKLQPKWEGPYLVKAAVIPPNRRQRQNKNAHLEHRQFA